MIIASRRDAAICIAVAGSLGSAAHSHNFAYSITLAFAHKLVRASALALGAHHSGMRSRAGALYKRNAQPIIPVAPRRADAGESIFTCVHTESDITGRWERTCDCACVRVRACVNARGCGAILRAREDVLSIKRNLLPAICI